MRKLLVLLSCLILGSLLGWTLSTFWNSGANIFWKQINYFPHSVKEIIALKPYGRGFWVKTPENEIYQITYPCLNNEICWIKSGDVPSNFLDGIPAKYSVSRYKCENDNFTYPLFHKIRMCITVIVYDSDITGAVSLALTEDSKLWIWDNPSIYPYTMFFNNLLSVTAGAIIGLLTGVFLFRKSS